MNLTLVIPTYNRPDCLRRLLGFLQEFGYDGDILVADSSLDQSRDVNRAHCEKWQAVSYVEFPSDTPPFTKFAQAITLTKTDFVALLADDDLALPGGLSDCVAFLEKNPNYSAAHGIYLRFDVLPDRIAIPGIEYDAPSIEDATAFGRLNNLMSHYQALTYCVQRRDCALAAFENASQLNGVLWQELAGGSLTAMQGQVKRLDMVTHARQGGSTLGYQQWHPVEWLSRDAAGLFRGFAEYVDSVRSFAERCQESEDMSTGEIHEAANAAALRYLLPYLQKADQVLLWTAMQDIAPEPKASATIDRWNDLHAPFPKSLLLKYGAVGRVARAVKRTLPLTISGTSITTDIDGTKIQIEIGRSVVQMLDKDTRKQLSKQFARYLSL